MRTLNYARARARELRLLVGSDPSGLLERLRTYIEASYALEILPVASGTMARSRGEITPSGVLKYDERLTLEELLEMLAHELGHLVLHERLTDSTVPPDPLLGSIYAESGAGAVARYSPRMFEEAQASAFATEFLCPSDEVMRAWRADSTATAASLAARYGVSTDVMRVQLAQAVYELIVSPSDEAAVMPRKGTVAYDESQLGAARHVGTPALVDAGPGTGKTATLVRRIRFAIEEHGAHPRQILVLTFSDEAARELHERIAREFGDGVADQMTIATFHGFGMTVLHYHGSEVGLGTDFTVLDEDAQAALINRLLGSVSCDLLITLRDPTITVDALVKHIGHCKDRLRDCDALAAELENWAPESDDESRAHAAAQQFLEVFRAYEQAKAAAQAVDFADLISLPIRILDARADVATAYRDKYPWVLVDEFQDVSRATSKLLAHLCGRKNPPWVVGDARQAIYRFRGAAPDNVSKFEEDFPNASRLELTRNYRSSAPVILAANELAALMETPGAAPDTVRERWTPAGDVLPLSDSPIRLATASSDAAERLAIAAQVQEWLTSGDVRPEEIAILARRNVDVREIILALGNIGITAAASGLLTAEGAAGDLASILTAVDAPRPSTPRLVYALGRGRFDRSVLNATVHALLHGEPSPSGEPKSPSASAADVGQLAAEVGNVLERLNGEARTADGFALLAAFLFDASVYLRRLLDAADSAERSMALVEIVSVLVLAGADRVTRPTWGTSVGPDAPTPSRLPNQSARSRRLSFAERLRVRLTGTTPVPIAPARRAGAVRVMTCHASKGLEFPCVIVAGQTLPTTETVYAWLPPAWRPAKQEDLDQADALLFVGVTRAKRALVVSHPASAGGGPRGRSKQTVPLLGRWEAWRSRDCIVWDGPGTTTSTVRVGLVWGGRPPARFSLRSLDGKTCTIATYLQDFVGLALPTSERPLYPIFVDVVRRALRAVVTTVHASGRSMSEGEADAVLDTVWSSDDFADHPHAALYRATARHMTRRFAARYTASNAKAEVLDPTPLFLDADGAPGVRLDLVGHIRYADGRVEALSFRPESLPIGKNGRVNWSELGGAARLSFVLLAMANTAITPRLFSGHDGLLLDFAWSQRKDSLPNEQSRMIAQRDAFQNGLFETTVSSFRCNSCTFRICCPVWIGATAPVSES